MEEIVTAISDFGAQPLGVIGVLFVMSATTAINSTQAIGWFEGRRVSILLPYNGLNLVGAVSLLVNALLQKEVVWLMLEIYLIGIAIKGLVQVRRQRNLRISHTTPSHSGTTDDNKTRSDKRPPKPRTIALPATPPSRRLP